MNMFDRADVASHFVACLLITVADKRLEPRRGSDAPRRTPASVSVSTMPTTTSSCDSFGH